MVLMAVTSFLSSLLLGLDKVSKFHTNLLCFFKDDREIVATETKRITQGNIDFTLLSFIKSKVQFRIEIRIVSKMINGWRNNPFIESKQARDCFYRAGSTQQMSGHTLGRTDVQLIRMLTKNFLNGFDLSDITKWC